MLHSVYGEISGAAMAILQSCALEGKRGERMEMVDG
jgi:hypothetical protein